MQQLLLPTLVAMLFAWTAFATSRDSSGWPATQSPNRTPRQENQGFDDLGQNSTQSTDSPESDGAQWTDSISSANIEWSDDFNTDYVSHAKSCWNVYTSWYASRYASSIAGSTTVVNSTLLETYTTSSTAYPTTSISTYTLCDGVPRAHYSPLTTVLTATSVEVFPAVSTVLDFFPPEPQCQPNQNDCAVLYYGTNLSGFPGDSFPFLRLLGACGYPLDADFPCLIQGGPAKLYYFPVTTTRDAICAPESTTITPTLTPEPVTTLGTTLFPDSAYIYFETLYAAYRPFSGPGGAAAQIGPNFSHTIIGLKSEDVSTNCYATWWNRTQGSTPGYGPGTQLNFADLNSPVPASAYMCQNQCVASGTEDGNGADSAQNMNINPCTTIFDNFNPLLAVPTTLREMVPEWNKCKFWSPRQANVIFDPPHALTEALSAALPTVTPGWADPSALPSPTAPGIPGPTAPSTAKADDILSASGVESKRFSSATPENQGVVPLSTPLPALASFDSLMHPSSQQDGVYDASAQTTMVPESRTKTSGESYLAVAGSQPPADVRSAISVEGQTSLPRSQDLFTPHLPSASMPVSKTTSELLPGVSSSSCKISESTCSTGVPSSGGASRPRSEIATLFAGIYGILLLKDL